MKKNTFSFGIFLSFFLFGLCIYPLGHADSPAKPAMSDIRAHITFKKVLENYVKVKGAVSQVDYANLKKNQSKSGLNQYLTRLSAVPKKTFDSWNKNDQMAFYINAYNGFTLKLIVDNYPVSSIKKIGGFFSSPWKKEFFSLFGKKRTLDEIEHGILRKDYKDARVHFAVNCASIGCPMLSDKPFVGKTLNEQLDTQARLFLRDKSRNTIIERENKLVLSKIFDWFEEDFVAAKKSVAQFVAPYMTDDVALQKEIASGKFRISFHSYDWKLNKIQ